MLAFSGLGIANIMMYLPQGWGYLPGEVEIVSACGCQKQLENIMDFTSGANVRVPRLLVVHT